MSESYTSSVVYNPTLIDAAGSTESSAVMQVYGAQKIGIYLTADSINNRSGVLTITVSPDGSNFYAYNMLISNAANANSENLTRVDSKTRNTDGTDILWLSPETLGGFTHIKATITITDGDSPAGTFTVLAIITT